MRAVGYYRPQRPAEVDGGPSEGNSGTNSDGILRAVDAIHRYCADNRHQLIRIFHPFREDPLDGEDGLAADEQYAALVQHFSGPDGMPALVVTPDITHFAPDLETLTERLIELQRFSAEVRCADPLLPDSLQNALEHLELRGRASARSRRIRNSILAKAARGEVLGRTPFGYAAGIDGQLRPLPDEAETVRRVFHWYVGSDGDGKEQAGLRRIAARLNVQGSRTRSGLPWTPVSVAGVLRNRAYVGTYSRFGMRITGSHPPIVDRAVFAQAQAALEARRPARRRAEPEPFLLGGLVRCATCGRGLFGLTRRRTWRRRDGSTMIRSYRYYECQSRAGEAADTRHLHPAWRTEKLERAVRQELEHWSHRCSAPLALELELDRGSAERRRRRLGRAERSFVRRLRDVSTGVGRLDDLRGPLDELREARRALGESPAVTTLDTVLLTALGTDVQAARQAMSAILERISVGPTSIELVMRHEITAAVAGS